MVDLYLQEAAHYNKLAAENDLAQRLAAEAGYDPADIADFRRLGGRLETLVPKPQPMKSTVDQEFDAMKREAEVKRLKKVLNPAPKLQPFTDPTSGQMSDVEINEEGRRVLTPQQLEDGSARYAPKISAFKGEDEAGNRWEMSRGQYGEAKDYRVTKKAVPKVRTITRADGSKVKAVEKWNPETNEMEYNEVAATLDGEELSTASGKKTFESDWVKGKKVLVNGEWVTDEETAEPNRAAVKTWTGLTRQRNALKQEAYKLKQSIVNDGKRVDPAKEKYLSELEGKTGRIEEQMQNFETMLRNQAGDKILYKLRGRKEEEYPRDPVPEVKEEPLPKGTPPSGTKDTDGTFLFHSENDVDKEKLAPGTKVKVWKNGKWRRAIIEEY